MQFPVKHMGLAYSRAQWFPYYLRVFLANEFCKKGVVPANGT